MATHPVVGIVMGSDSDLAVMELTAKALERFGIPFELKISSAHRSLDATLNYVRQAEARGIKVIVAGAAPQLILPASLLARPHSRSSAFHWPQPR